MKSKKLLIEKIKTIENLLNELKDSLSDLKNINYESEMAANISSRDVHSILDLTPTRRELTSRAKAHSMEQMNSNQFGIIIDRSITFENFIIGQSNNMALAASKAIAKNPGKSGKYPSIYIHSSTGLGKTHLLHAIANEITIHHPNLNTCLISSKNFMDEMIHLMKNNRTNEFIKNYTENVDILMIDDIQELKNKEGTQEQFFHLFNEMHNRGKQLIFTSDKRPKELEYISERIKSRLQWGLVIDIQPPELETCVAILHNLTRSLNFALNPEILHLIAESTEPNPRALESAMTRLKSASELMNVEVGIDFVKEQLLMI